MTNNEILNLWGTIFVMDLARYFIGVGVVLLALYIFRKYLSPYKLQKESPTRKQIQREFFHSIKTVAIYATIGIGVYTGVEIGLLQIYGNLDSYSAFWAFISFPVILIIHDTYFYWVHRLMHWKKIFKYSHKVHHLSRTPTAWCAYSFNALEAVMMALFVPLYTLFIPIFHQTLIVYLVFMIIRNAAGHSGYELFKKDFVTGKFGWNNTVFHHDLHHQSFNYNYSLYFTWWDRWMGTEHPEYRSAYKTIHE